jgi:hypothetical protein
MRHAPQQLGRVLAVDYQQPRQEHTAGPLEFLLVGRAAMVPSRGLAVAVRRGGSMQSLKAHHANPLRRCAVHVIDPGTLAGLLERRHEFDAYCSRCDRWQTSPLVNLVARGQDARRLPVPLRCS